MFTITYTSVRCDGDFPSKTEFATVDDAKRHIRQKTPSVYWQAFILDSAGNRVVRGVRSGYNTTGKRWIFT